MRSNKYIIQIDFKMNLMVLIYYLYSSFIVTIDFFRLRLNIHLIQNICS
jgi:hypothetical protein